MNPDTSRLQKIVELHKDFDGVIILKTEGYHYICDPWLKVASVSMTVQVSRIESLLNGCNDPIIELDFSEFLDVKAELNLMQVKYKVVQVVFSEDTVTKN